jgi:prephenate dehydrogenase (NADP+)
MGTAWSSAKSYPWEEGFYVGGIETVKVNIMLRIYANQWHTYAGLAILNPPARLHIDQYANSTTEIFKLMLNHNEDALRERMYRAKEKVFGPSLECGGQPRRPILLSESVLDKFSLGKRCKSQDGPGTNSHLSLLAMVDCWAHLNINPFEHLALAATPIFRLFLGVAETLFVSSIPESSPSSPTVEGSTDAERSLNGAETGRKSIIPPCPLCHPEMGVVASRLDVAIHAACQDMLRRSDDLEFTIAARGWSQCVSFGSFRVYQQRFEQTRLFFESRFEEANKLGAEMVKAVMETEVKE